jgi:hypothetical protein
MMLKKLLGYGLLSLPFLVIFVGTVIAHGWLVLCIMMGVVVFIVGCIGWGVYLVEGPTSK